MKLHKLIKDAFEQDSYETQRSCLFDLFEYLKDKLKVDDSIRTHQFGASGLLLASIEAATCLQEPSRTLGYWHALITAIKKRSSETSLPIKILYPGCGPFASLILPVFAGLVEESIELTLVEINQQAVQSVKKLIADLSNKNIRIEVHHCDILDFETTTCFDLMICECMLASLHDEGQVAITHHLTQFLDDKAILIPQRIEVSLVWSDLSNEIKYVEKHRKPGQGISPELLAVFREFVVKLISLDKNVRDLYPVEDNGLNLGPMAFKNSVPPNKTLILTTRIRLLDDIELEEYQNGLTSPVAAGEGMFVKGEEVNMFFKLKEKPGFVPVF